MKTIKNYHDLYLISDVVLLSNAFEKFRNNSLKNYGISPGHYLSTPASNWDTMLNMAKVGLKLILDLDMYIFFEKAARDPKRESKHIIYLDANNLYGYAMSKFLQTSGFK